MSQRRGSLARSCILSTSCPRSLNPPGTLPCLWATQADHPHLRRQEPGEASTKEDGMHAEHDDIMAPERGGATRTVVSTTLYDLMAVVEAAVEPGEEACVAPIVAHLLRAGHAQCLRGGD